eukprot:1155171-Pelagomonas_calceolata.AAC.6
MSAELSMSRRDGSGGPGEVTSGNDANAGVCGGGGEHEQALHLRRHSGGDIWVGCTSRGVGVGGWVGKCLSAELSRCKQRWQRWGVGGGLVLVDVSLKEAVDCIACMEAASSLAT